MTMHTALKSGCKNGSQCNNTQQGDNILCTLKKLQESNGRKT